MFRMDRVLPFLPPGERDAASRILLQSSNIEVYVLHYEAAVGLMEFAARRPNLSQWQHIAARDAAMTVWHVGKILDEGFSTKNCRTFGAALSKSGRLKAARLRLKEDFPDYELARNAVGHSAEHLADGDKRQLHSADGPFEIPGFIKVAVGAKDVFLGGNLVQGTLHSTHRGAHQSVKVVSSRCDRKGVADLRAIGGLVSEAFEGAAIQLRSTSAAPWPK